MFVGIMKPEGVTIKSLDRALFAKWEHDRSAVLQDLPAFFALLKKETAQFTPLLAHALDGQRPNVFLLPHQHDVRAPQPHLCDHQQAQAGPAGERRPRQRLGRPAHAHHRRPAPPGLHAAEHPDVCRTHRRDRALFAKWEHDRSAVLQDLPAFFALLKKETAQFTLIVNLQPFARFGVNEI
ncbi:hypothetical protein [Mycobacterium tuberculosis]|uniref:hypothetical protein n=1 Tax=Mycobacterium tuberculosis TaxID=1773 RepID=UPI00272D24F6|nr:hypothetical protein [Mycobacterium tuberculosis]